MSKLRDLAVSGASLAVLVLGVSCRGEQEGPAEPVAAARAADSPAPATLYSVLQNGNVATEGPVRGDPGDVLLLPGAGFASYGNAVVYQAISDTTAPPVHPTSVPTGQTAALGVVSPLAVDANAVTVVLPTTMTAGQSYALWVVSQAGWSNPVLINDARPMWMLPGPLAPAHGSSPYPYVYTTAPRPGVQRFVKIFGRNLQPAPNQAVQVIFVDPGGGQHAGTVVSSTSDPSTPYAVRVSLPSTLPLVGNQATNYTVVVSRDGTSWVPLATPMTVLPDPPAGNFGPPSGQCPSGANVFYPETYGCSPCDAVDDTLCISRAIAAAKAYSDANSSSGNIVSGNVVFHGTCSNGATPTWVVAGNCNADGAGHLLDAASYQGVACYLTWGIDVPAGVNLVADPCAAQVPTIQTGQAFDQPALDAAKTAGACGGIPDVTPCSTDTDCCPSGTYAQHCVLASAGSAQCLGAGAACTSDAECCSTSCTNGACAAGKCEYRPPDNRQYLFQLEGANVVQGLHIEDTWSASYKTIEWPGQQIFAESSPGLGGVIIKNNDITLAKNFFENTFYGVGAVFPVALPDGLTGNMDIVIQGNTFASFYSGVGLAVVEDSVIDGNTFYPGASLGAAAVGTLGSRRLDVSANTLAGTVTTYSGPYVGWRGGLFFPTFGSQEQVLASNNQISCVGTRPYQDGEAIATDSNGALPGFRAGEPVVSADGTHVTTGWPASANYPSAAAYVGTWLRVSSGPGLGQARKITAATAGSSTITFTVAPAFDVAPTSASRVLAGNQAWQMFIAGNTIDNTCTASLTTGTFPNLDPSGAALFATLHPGAGGVIELYGNSADVAIDSNTQTDTAGISIWSEYADWTTGGAHSVYHTDQYFVDIRGNSVSYEVGGYQNPSNTFGSGIYLVSNSTTMVDGAVQGHPNVPGFGVSVSHNTLTGAALTGLGEQAGQSAGIALAPIQMSDESSAPGYLDTLVFANDLVGTSATAAGSAPWSSAICNGANGGTAAVGMPNYPRSTVLCENQFSSFPSPGYSDWPGAGEASSLILCSSGAACAGGAAPTDFFSPTMVGCGGTVTWDQRATLCGPGSSPCTPAQWAAIGGAVVPAQDYWTNGALAHYAGTASGACEAVPSGGSSCDPGSPMRVCTPHGSPAGTDSFGNTCALVDCGLGTLDDRYLGGCLSNPTAGTLCCAASP